MEADYSGGQSSPWAVAPRERKEGYYKYLVSEKTLQKFTVFCEVCDCSPTVLTIHIATREHKSYSLMRTMLVISQSRCSTRVLELMVLIAVYKRKRRSSEAQIYVLTSTQHARHFPLWVTEFNVSLHNENPSCWRAT
jgi:hypothetical protein